MGQAGPSVAPKVTAAPRAGKRRATGPPCRMETDCLGVPLPPASPMRLFEGIWGHGGAVSLPGPPAALGLWQGGQGVEGSKSGPSAPHAGTLCTFGAEPAAPPGQGGPAGPRVPWRPSRAPSGPSPAQPLCRQPSGPHGHVPPPCTASPGAGGRGPTGASGGPGAQRSLSRRLGLSSRRCPSVHNKSTCRPVSPEGARLGQQAGASPARLGIRELWLPA